MQPKTIKLLEDICDAVVFVQQITDGKSLADYRADRMLRQAVERNFEIIGEAVLRLSRHDADVASQIDDYPQVIAFRNVLIHGYDLIDETLVWQVIRDDVPKLHEQVVVILKSCN